MSDERCATCGALTYCVCQAADDCWELDETLIPPDQRSEQVNTVVKVVRPIRSNNPRALWLVYDEEHTHEVEIPSLKMPERVKEAMGDALVAYFEGHWLPTYGWVFLERVDPQSW